MYQEGLTKSCRESEAEPGGSQEQQEVGVKVPIGPEPWASLGLLGVSCLRSLIRLP